MPYIETLDDIITDIANLLGIYEGQYTKEEIEKAHGHPDDCKCRMCFEIELNDRIRNAIKNEEMLYGKN